MEEHAYSGRPTRNPLRFLLALWRTVRDPSNTAEVAIVEIGVPLRFGLDLEILEIDVHLPIEVVGVGDAVLQAAGTGKYQLELGALGFGDTVEHLLCDHVQLDI